MSGTPPPPPPPYGGEPGPPSYGQFTYGQPGYGPPGYPAYGMPGYGGPPPPGSRTNGMAVASLVLGIIGVPFFCFVLPSVLAVVFGAVGIRQCNSNPAYSGKGMAIAGLILGVLMLVAFVALLVFGNVDYSGDLE